jgi:hypothetical protein
VLDPKLAAHFTILSEHLDESTLLATVALMRREIGGDIKRLRAAIGLWRLERRDVEEAQQLLQALETRRHQLSAMLDSRVSRFQTPPKMESEAA